MIDRRNFILKTGMLACSGLVLGGNSLAELRLSDIKRIKPKALKAGDTIAITSPAGAVWDEAQIETFSNILKGFRIQYHLRKNIKEKHGYFAGTDVLRANELNDLFANKKIKGIFCMKGGWGCARLLDKLDYKIIKENPKVLIGFSDITTLLIAITTKTGLITYSRLLVIRAGMTLQRIHL